MEDGNVLKNTISKEAVAKMKEIVERPGKTTQHSTGTIFIFRILMAMDICHKTSDKEYVSIWYILLQMRDVTDVNYPSKAACDALVELSDDKLITVKKTTTAHPATDAVQKLGRYAIVKDFGIANESVYKITELGLQVAAALVSESRSNEDYSHFMKPGLFAHLQVCM